MNTDDLRDGLARALYEDDAAHGRMTVAWHDMSDGEDEWYRDQADAALAYLASRADECGTALIKCTHCGVWMCECAANDERGGYAPIVQAWPMEDPPGNGPVSDAGTRSAQGHLGGPESGSDAAGRADRWVGAVVTSGEELDALPDGSAIGLVRRGEFRAFRKSGERWEDERGVRFDEDWLPVRLLYVGEWQGDE